MWQPGLRLGLAYFSKDRWEDLGDFMGQVPPCDQTGGGGTGTCDGLKEGI